MFKNIKTYYRNIFYLKTKIVIQMFRRYKPSP